MTKVLDSLDLTRNEIQNVRAHSLAGPPGDPVGGLFFLDTAESPPRLKYYNGTDWIYADGLSAVVNYGPVTEETTFGGVSADGGATTVSRSDHQHGNPAHGTAQHAAGTILPTASPGSSGVGDTADEGGSGSVARADHRHGREAFASVQAETAFGTASQDGVASTLIRADHRHGTPTHDAAAHSAVPLTALAAPTTDVGLNGHKITGLANGSASADAATFGQLNAVIHAQTWKEPVRAASTADLALTGTQTIDGVALDAGDRVLVKNQAAAADNGIYVVAAGAWARAPDADSAAEHTNATALVREGTIHQGDIFTQSADITTLGTDPQTWTQTGEGNTTYTADGSTLELVGTQFRIADAGVNLTGAKVTGTLPADRGGTGQAAFVVGDLLQASATTALARLAAVATGNVLLSGGVGAQAAWGKVGLATHITGTLGLANGGTGATDADGARTNLGVPGKYAVDIGDGASTAIEVTHNLGTRDVGVTVYLNSGTFEKVIVDVEHTEANYVTIRFAVAPATNAYRAVVMG